LENREKNYIFAIKLHNCNLFIINEKPMKKSIFTLFYFFILPSLFAQENEIKILSGHSDDITSLVFAKNGKWLVSASQDNSLCVWNIESGEKMKILSGHTDNVWAVAVSPDGKFLASGAWDNIIKIWDTDSWNCLKTITKHTDFVNCLAFSPNGNLLVSGSANGIVKIWNTSTFDEVKSFSASRENIWSLAFSADGNYLATTGNDRTIKIWNTNTWQTLHIFTEHTETVCCVAFSPNGKYIASGSCDKTVKIWSTETWKLMKNLTNFQGHVWTVAFSPDSKYLVSGGFDRRLTIWKIENWGEVKSFIDKKAITCAAFSPTEKFLAIGGWDNTVKLCNLSSLELNIQNNPVEKQNDEPQNVDILEKRIALVIGNSNYKNESKLLNPKNDADSISNVLRQLNFEVLMRTDLELNQMKDAINDFGNKVKSAKEEGFHVISLFYFSGHGMQVDGKNYLLPLNDKIGGKEDVPFETVDVDRILAKLEASGSSLNIVILDACRSNPFEKRFSSQFKSFFPDFQEGLAQPNLTSSGTLIAYATSPGKIALDGEGTNSPYIEELLKNIRKPNLTIEQVFKQVRIGVLRRTREVQLPWEANSLIGEFYFLKKK